jgi:cytochrome bd-type quinol oxidase subunit 2
LLDIKTLMVCNVVIIFFVAIALIIYWKEQKTYFGFGMWVLAAILAVLGYAFLIPRGIIPVWVSILGNNALFVLVVLCRLDGILRFLNDRKLHKIYYAVPVPVVAFSAYYYFVDDWIAMRTLVLGIAFFPICLASFWLLLKYAPKYQKRFYRLAAFLVIVFGFTILLRGVIWLADPQGDIFRASFFQVFYFLLIMLNEAGIGMLFLMMNSQRTEAKLIDAQNELHATVSDLETALSEIKTLSGLLPICASCKKIRDDKGYWNQIESYIRTHSSAEFSHSICPDCIKKLYPDFADQVLEDLKVPHRKE